MSNRHIIIVDDMNNPDSCWMFAEEATLIILNEDGERLHHDGTDLSSIIGSDNCVAQTGWFDPSTLSFRYEDDEDEDEDDDYADEDDNDVDNDEDFSDALDMMMHNSQFTRRSWPERLIISCHCPITEGVQTGEPRLIISSHGRIEGSTTWFPTQEDLFADDYILVAD